MAGTAGAVRAGRAFVEFYLNDKKLHRGLKRAETRLRAFGTGLQSAGTKAFAGFAAGVSAIAFPTMIFAKFDDQIRELGAVSRASAKDLEKLRDQAKKLGRETSFTAVDVAGAQTELARAGFNPAEIEAATPAILDLARATRTELPRAAEVASAALRSFNLTAEQMPMVADVITAATANSALGFEDMAEAMKYAAPIADEFGLSIQETAKNIGALGNVGIKGSQAGTTLRTVMLRLANPKIQKQIAKYAEVTDKATGGFRNLADIMHDLAKSTEDLPTDQRLALFNNLFGKNAITGAVKLAASEFENLNDAIDAAAGSAAKTAKEMDAGIGGAIRMTLSAAEGALIAIGEAADSTVQSIGQKLQKLFGVIARVVEKNPQMVQGFLKALLVLGAVGTTLITTGIAFRFMAFAVGGFLSILKGMGAALALAKTAFVAVGGVLTILLNPVGLLAAGVLALAGYFLYTSGAIQGAAAYLSDVFGPAWNAIVEKISSGDLVGAASIAFDGLKLIFLTGTSAVRNLWSLFNAELAKTFLGIVGTLEIAWIEFSSGMVNAFSSAVAKIKNIWQATTNQLAEWLAVAIAKASGQDVGEVLQTLREDQQKGNRDYEAEARSEVEQRSADARRRIEDTRQAVNDSTAIVDEDTQRQIEQAEADLERKKQEFAATIAPATPENPDGPNPDGTATPETIAEKIRRMVDEVGKKAKGGKLAAQQTADAVLFNTTEGQKAILEAMGLKGKDETVVALEKIATTVKDEAEKDRRENRKAPRLKAVKV